MKFNKSILRESKTLFAVLAVSAVALLAAAEARMTLGIIDQSAIDDALIQHKYQYSKMESVTSNYLMETDISVLIELLHTTQNFNKLRQTMYSWLNSLDSEIVAEYNTMQEYRKYAKQLAKNIVNKLEPNSEEE